MNDKITDGGPAFPCGIGLDETREFISKAAVAQADALLKELAK